METVNRFLLRLLLIPSFIFVLPFPLLACPNLVTFQVGVIPWVIPRIIWGLLVRI